MVQIADFVEAPHSGGDYRKVLIVEHVTISPETRGAARGVVANWNRARNGSTQFVVDSREIIQAVPETAYAWAAGTTANIWGIHIEHCGYLQTLRQWRDGYSTAELELSSALTAELCAKHGIPARRIGPAQIRKAVASGDPADGGICGHIDITRAFPGETTHTDPGRFFPWDRFIDLVTEHEEDDMPSVDDIWRHRIKTNDGSGRKDDDSRSAEEMLAQAHRRAADGRDAAREAVQGIGDLAALIRTVPGAGDELKALADQIVRRTAAAVERLDAERVAERLDVIVKKGGQR